MAQKNFVVQHTGYPVTRKIEEHEWKNLSEHTSYSAAQKAIDSYTSHLHGAQWDDHYRVIRSDGQPVTDDEKAYEDKQAERQWKQLMKKASHIRF